MIQLLFVGIGGFIGACARFGLTKLFETFSTFPFGTLISNILAGFIIGLVIGIDREVEALFNIVFSFTAVFIGLTMVKLIKRYI